MADIRDREKARLELQERLDAAKEQSERNRLGQFATPSELASEIVAYAVSLLPPDCKIRFLEPGFGTGPFYSALLWHVPASRLKAAAGYEIDPDQAGPTGRLWKGTPLRLHAADFTKAEPPTTEAEKYNLVVCNPPYVRHHHLLHTQKRELQAAVARYGNSLMNGLSGLYAYFMVLSQAWMTKDGVAAWLIPSEFMDVNYGRRVKEFLTEKVTLCRIHRFDPGDVQFGDALVSSALVFFTNSPPGKREPEFTLDGTLNKPKVRGSIKLTDLRRVSKWTGLPQGVNRLLERRDGSELADLFTIKRGLATGCNSFFVLTPDRVKELKVPSRFLMPILPSPRNLQVDEISADEDGEPLIENRHYLLSCDLSESEVRAKYPALWRYLERGMKEGVHERYLCRHRDPWYSQEKRPPAPFLCTYMGRPTARSKSPFRFIVNHSKATVPNVYLVLYPKPTLTQWLRDDPDRRRAVWKGLSLIEPETLVGEGRVYGGGLHKLEPKELGRVAADIVLNALEGGRDLPLHRQLEMSLG